MMLWGIINGLGGWWGDGASGTGDLAVLFGVIGMWCGGIV